MSHFWNVFWKTFGIALVAILAAAVIAGITRSADTAYLIVRLTFIVALGLCGTIVMRYLEDKKLKEIKYAAE